MGDLRGLLRGSGFRRLLAVRVATQLADGAFEASLAILFFFSPERATTPLGIAAAFAVLTLPFTLVGPWAGVPLDRWSRRDTLVVGSVARALLAGAAAVLMATGQTAPLYVVVLAVVSINRLLLSAISAGLPHVVATDGLVLANAVTPTMGTVGSVVGAAAAYTAIWSGAAPALVVTGVAIMLVLTAGLSLRLHRRQLGPVRGEVEAVRAARHPVAVVAREMVSGVRYLRGRRAAATALLAMTAHRFLFGAATLAAVLVARSRFGAHDAGLSASGLLVSAAAAGLLLAAVSTPVWTRRTAPATVATLALAGMGAALLVLSWTASTAVFVVASVALGWGGQSLKICVDTIVQRDVTDEYRGRVFSLYDMLFNAAFLVAMALLAPLVPGNGYSPALFALLALGYLVTVAAYRRSRAEAAGFAFATRASLSRRRGGGSHR